MTNHACWGLAFACLWALFAAGCTGRGCPSGSEEVDGFCVPLDGGAPDGSAGSDGSAGMGGGGSPSDGGGTPDGGDAAGARSGTGGDGGAPQIDGGAPQIDGGGDELDPEPDPAPPCDPACDPNARCEVSDGMGSCVCEVGYEGDGLTCTRNPCQPLAGEGPVCDVNATCSAGDGEAICTCLDGYQGSGTPGECTRVPCTPLQDQELVCDDNASCTVDNNGEPRCTCLQGYTGSGEPGECTRAPCTPLEGDDPPCDENATCTPDGDQAQCECDVGYTGDGTSCSDVDECAMGSDDCHANATCTNTVGGFDCSCDAGYEGDGRSCSDVDECTEGLHDCDTNATCTNSGGGFDCACIQGYEGDGTSCTRDLCQPLQGQTPPCGAHTTCDVQDGQAVCTCEPGFADCDGSPNSCETDLQNDAGNCGACGYSCAGSLRCSGGACEQALSAISLGSWHSCGLEGGSGVVLCWGSDNGQLQRAPADDQAHYEPGPTAGDPLERLALGQDHACGVTAGGALQCWGSNNVGALGGNEDPFPPAFSAGLVEIADYPGGVPVLDVGSFHQCLLTGGTMECWGLNGSYQCGTQESSSVFYADRFSTDAFTAVTGFALGVSHSCVLHDGGSVECWGANDLDQLGRTTSEQPTELAGPVQTENGTIDNATHISAYDNTTCAVVGSAGSVRCWGDNSSGQLGDGTSGGSFYVALPVERPQGVLAGAVQVAVGAEHACARREGGTVACWGRADRLGDGSSGTEASLYIDVPGIDDAIDLAAGGSHTCVRLGTGQVQCWGDNSDGQLGLDPSQYSERLTPTDVPSLP